MHQCILNVPLWNDWSKVTYSQVHGSPVLKALSLKSLNWISAAKFAEIIQLGQDPKLRSPTKIWRKISYFNFTYVNMSVSAIAHTKAEIDTHTHIYTDPDFFIG